jgi:hypothetical protein
MSTVFRVYRPDTLRAQAEEPPPSGVAAYMGRLIKLIPAEVLGVYQTLYGIFVTPPPSALLQWLPVLGFILVIVVRAWGARDSSGRWSTVQWPAVGISAVSFVIWVLVSGHSILGHVLPDMRIGSAAMVLWVFLLPLIYKGV